MKKTPKRTGAVRRQARSTAIRGVATTATWFFADSLMHYTTNAQMNTKWDDIFSTTVTAGQGAFGQPGIRPPDTSNGLMKNFTATGELVLSFHAKHVATTGKMIQLRTAGGGSLQIQVNIYNDGTVEISNGGAIAASAAASVSFTVQHHWRIAIKFATATGNPSTYGKVRVDVDGNTIINATNVNTNPAGTGQATQARFWGSGSAGVADAYYSHFLFGASFTDGEGLQPRVTAVYATGNGSDADMLDQDGNVPANPKTLINETTPDDATYLRGETANQRNSFFYANSLPVIARVLAIQRVPRVGKTDASSRTGRTYFTLGGNRYFYPSNIAVPSSPAYKPQMWVEDPSNPGNEFTPAQVNAPIETGYEVVT